MSRFSKRHRKHKANGFVAGWTEPESTHHRKPRSIGGTDEERNLSDLPKSLHNAWHTLFTNMTARQTADEINRRYLDRDYIFIAVRRKKWKKK